MTELRRASWAVAFVGQSGKMQLTVSGPVWDHLPQTPQSGEYVSAVAAIQIGGKPFDLVGDCLGVTEAVSKLKFERVPCGVHTGVFRNAITEGNLDLMQTFTWMPSHRTIADDASEADRARHAGNKFVDTKAAEARTRAE